MFQQAKEFRDEPINYLITQKSPSKHSDEFYRDETDEKARFSRVVGAESHLERRRAILKAHPEVMELLKPTKPYTILIALVLLPLSLWVSLAVREVSWPVYLLTLYFVTGTLTHTFHVVIHELTHNIGHSNPTFSKLFAVICNIPSGVPSAISFGKYHADHHNYMGLQGKDPDLPIQAEADMCLKYGTPFKLLYMLLCALFYAFRPMIIYNTKMNSWEIFNIIFIVLTDFLIYHFFGLPTLVYCLLGALISIGPHPAAMHVFAEHFIFVDGMETYDYFGPMNWINFNLGYHTEHHDFPTCPWYNLPKIRALAKEYYEYLPYHTSYTAIMYKFVMDSKFNLFSRTLREEKSSE